MARFERFQAQSNGQPLGGAEPAPCGSCGGSGVLRTDGSGYRTCLACVGQGVLPQFVGNDPLSAAMVRALMGRPRRSRPPAPISASTSGAR